MSDIYSIGFTEKSASKFFELLKSTKATKLIDIRLNNASQLAGYTKKDDLQYFLYEILHWDYEHRIELAPTKIILDNYRETKDWNRYEFEFNNLLDSRNVDKLFSEADIINSVLLCSENRPHHCHRRLVAEFFKLKWDSDIEIKHLF